MALLGRFDLTAPILGTVSDGSNWSTDRLVRALALELHATDEELRLRRADGKLRFRGEVDWARTWLHKAALVEYPGPATTKITASGHALAASRPSRLDKEFFIAWRNGLQPDTSALATSACDETLEDELRRLSGPAVIGDIEWEAVRRVNGWGPEVPMRYKAVAAELGIEIEHLRAVAKSCFVAEPPDAPLLDAALVLALHDSGKSPLELSLELALSGITRDAFSLGGLCEAAYRFGRRSEWRELLSYLSAHHPSSKSPAPFGSWFEVDVFLFVCDLGYECQPQKRLSRYRADLFLPEFSPQVVIECDGPCHDASRTSSDRQREKDLMKLGHTIVRVPLGDFMARPAHSRQVLAEQLAFLATGGQQLRMDR